MSFDSCKDMLSIYTRTVVLLIEWWDLEVSAADEFTSFDLVPIQATCVCFLMTFPFSQTGLCLVKPRYMRLRDWMESCKCFVNTMDTVSKISTTYISLSVYIRFYLFKSTPFQFLIIDKQGPYGHEHYN